MPDAAAGLPPRRRWRRWLAGGAALVAAYVAGANAYLIAKARAVTVSDVAAAPSRPFAIVLGNHVYPDGTPADELEERLKTALQLYAAGRVQKVIASGEVRPGYDEPRAMVAWLAARGVKAEDLIVDPGGYRTAATMADSAALGVRSALVVTQAYHLPRSIFLARHAGIDAVGVPALPRRERMVVSARIFVREIAARAEIVLEVALRGVR